MKRIQLKLIYWWDTLLLKLFVTIGARLFGYARIWAPKNRRNVRAVHFAVTQHDMNISVRTYVDWLDSRRD
jgi:hypothetical protein